MQTIPSWYISFQHLSVRCVRDKSFLRFLRSQVKTAKDRTEVLEKAQSLVEGEFFPRGAMPLAGGVGHAQAVIPWNHVIFFHAAQIQKSLH